MTQHRIFAIVGSVALTAMAVGEPGSETQSSPTRSLLTSEEMPKWKLCSGYEKSRPWTLEEGMFWGYGSLIGYEQTFTNFVLECDILFGGKGEGGIQLRSNRTAQRN